MYTFYIANNGEVQAEITKRLKPSFGWKYNDLGSLSFVIPISISGENEALQYLSESSEIWIKENGILCWAGVVTNIQDDIDESIKQVKIDAKECGVLLKDRFVSATFGSIQEAQIAFGLINQTQIDTLGIFTPDQVNLGFTAGTLENNITRDRTFANDEILKSLIAMTEVINGGDFEITPTLTKSSYKVFSWYKSRGSDNNVKFDTEDGSIIKVSRKQDMTQIANYILGSGTGITSIASDLTSASNYKVRQFPYDNKDVVLQPTLDSYTQGLVEKKANPINEYEFTILDKNNLIGQFDIGDYVTFKVDSSFTGGRWSLNQKLRVWEIQINIDDNDVVTTKLTVGEYSPSRTNSIQGIVRNIAERLRILEK
jgi:hypothetical protein